MRDDRKEPEYADDVHQEWLETIQAEGRDLTDWEVEFINDLSNGRRIVSRKQEAVLERIYVNKTPT